MSATVVEQFETAIHAGGTDVVAEIVSDDQGRLSADVTVTGEEGENPLELLGAKDVAAIHALFGRILAALADSTEGRG